mgnify:CR=1 FL=1
MTELPLGDSINETQFVLASAEPVLIIAAILILLIPYFAVMIFSKEKLDQDRREAKPDDIPREVWNKAKRAVKREQAQAEEARVKEMELALKAAEQAAEERAKELLEDQLERAKEILRKKEQGDA